MNDSPAHPTRRLFIGLMPDAGVQAAIDGHRQLWRWPSNARPTAPSQLHLTLHFLGDVPAERLPQLHQALAEVPVHEMQLTLRTPDLWMVAVLRPDENEALRDLRRRLAFTLAHLDLHTEGDWTPHVTLARKVDGAQPPESCPPIAWTVREFALVWSTPPADASRARDQRDQIDQHYQVLARYPFQDDPASSRLEIPDLDAARPSR
jgi:2'-5' RNA ligase